MYRALYCNVLITNEMHSSYNQFLFHSFLSALHVSNESNRSSSGARPNILCNTVHYFVLLMMNDWIRSKRIEQTKNCGIKIDYKNCASRWLLTHCRLKSISVIICRECECLLLLLLLVLLLASVQLKFVVSILQASFNCAL